MITLNDYLTASGKYPERAVNVPQDLIENAEKLLKVVNEFLQELNITEFKVSSGYRPSAVNAKVPGAAKKSLHTQCLAVDIRDDGSLDKLIQSRTDLLKKYSLWLEHPDNTPGWCHLDISTTRKDRPIRIFKP